MRTSVIAGFGAALVALSPAVAAGAVTLTPLGGYKHGGFDTGAAEIAAFDPVTKRLFVTNGESHAIDVLDLSDVDAPAFVGAVDMTAYGHAATSAAVYGSTVAVAVENDPKTDPGRVVFIDARDLTVLGSVEVGALPDMITFTPDGRYVLTADEAEVADDRSSDPEGTVSVIDVSAGFDAASVRLATFTAFNGQAVEGAKLSMPDATVAEQIEPEYIAVSGDGATAYVSLQEANAVAVVDIAAATVTAVKGLGFKDWSASKLDASDKDRTIMIKPWPVWGMYQPDAIAVAEIDGETVLVTANEGDSRDWSGYSEEVRVEDLPLDPGAFPNASALQRDIDIGRMKTTTELGDADGDGDVDKIYVYGARSISTWDAEGNQLWDSGSMLEDYLFKHVRQGFNANNDEQDYDKRSDDKGPEPEGVAIGVIDGRTLAFVGLERVSGIAVFDISDPAAGEIVGYASTRNFRAAIDKPAAGDLGPEGIAFIPAAASPNGQPLVIAAYEISGTIRVFSVSLD